MSPQRTPGEAVSLHVFAPGGDAFALPDGRALKVPDGTTALVVQAHAARSGDEMCNVGLVVAPSDASVTDCGAL